MPSFGGGAGSPVVPEPADVIAAQWCTGALPLAKYAQQYIGSECAFWGVADAGEELDMIWTLFQRQELARALCEAQEEIEQVAGFFLEPKWIEDEPQPCSAAGVYLLKWNHIIDGGVPAVDADALGEAVNLAPDPAVVGPFVTAATDKSELAVYYPGTAQEITPSRIDIVGVNATIYIPRCRLVEYSLIDNPAEGLLYTDLGNFQAKVDIYRIYNDDSDKGKFVSRTVRTCDEEELAICMTVKDHEISHVLAFLSTTSSCRGAKIDQARFNYASGITSLDRIADLAVTRLAHSKMPMEPCGYDRVKQMWRSDNIIPQLLSVERLECPFGLSNGAWMSWKFAGSISTERLSVFG